MVSGVLGQTEVRALTLSPISAELKLALHELCQTETLLIAMDFDGTMAPLVPRAEDARASPESAVAFSALATLTQTTTAFISGRALDSLRSVAQPAGNTLLIGSHGAETWFGPDAEPLRLDDSQAKLVQETIAVLNMVSAKYPGTTVETKPAGSVLHTRQAEDGTARSAVREAITALRPLGLHLHEGKRVLEAAVLKVDKGQGIELLREVSSATGVIFAGDDRTDENGFRVLRGADVGVKVGPGESAAKFRISSVQETAALLQTVFQLRSEALRARL